MSVVPELCGICGSMEHLTENCPEIQDKKKVDLEIEQEVLDKYLIRD